MSDNATGSGLAKPSKNEGHIEAASLRSEGQLIPIDDFQMWVERHGDGPPLLMLGGGFCNTKIGTPEIEAFAKYFTVYAFDARGHGQSSFGEGPITYMREAVDALSLMDALGLESAHIFGYSDGGCASLYLLFNYPHRIRTSTLSGTPYSQTTYNEWAKGLVKEFPRILARGEQDEMGVRDALMAMGIPLEKIKKLAKRLTSAWSTTPNFTLEMLATIATQVLVIEAGADEFVEKRHFEDMTSTLQNADRLVLPKMTHALAPYEKEIAEASAKLANNYENRTARKSE